MELILKNIIYKHKNAALETLYNINAKFDAGVNYIFGGQFAGKTTLLNILAGLLKQESGEINYNEICAEHTNSNNILYLPNPPVFFEKKNAEKNLKYFFKLRKLINIDYDKILQDYNLPKKTKVKNFDKKQKFMLSLARSYKKDVKLILMDNYYEDIETFVLENLKKFFNIKNVIIIIATTEEKKDAFKL